MPRKEYKTITVKKEVAEKFFKIIAEIKKAEKKADNSSFMERMLSEYDYVLRWGK